MNFLVLALNLEGKKLEERRVYLKDNFAPFARALHFLESVYLVNSVVMKAGFAERIFMLAFAQENFFLSLFCLDLAFANLAFFYFGST